MPFNSLQTNSGDDVFCAISINLLLFFILRQAVFNRISLDFFMELMYNKGSILI